MLKNVALGAVLLGIAIPAYAAHITFVHAQDHRISHNLEVSLHTPVSTLKRYVSRRLGIGSEINLFYGLRTLDNSQTLEQSGVSADSGAIIYYTYGIKPMPQVTNSKSVHKKEVEETKTQQ